jgi:D-alanine-D-alanine ligase
MRIGITYDLKWEGDGSETALAGAPDDSQEEFDSPSTIEAIAGVFRGLGCKVRKLGDGRELLELLLAEPPDFVFNIAEGHGVGRCREARVPAVLEMLGIPYSGSDPLTLSAALDKDLAKRLVQSAGLAVPGALVVAPDSDLATLNLDESPFPAILKPAWEGSSKGIRGSCLVDNAAHLSEVLQTMRQGYKQPILIEEFIQGPEVTVGIVGNHEPKILGVMSVEPRKKTERFVYSLEIKRDFQRLIQYECPPRLPTSTIRAIEKAALRAYGALDCRDVARVDFRVRDGVPYFLEINPLPGLNPETSDLVILARLIGWSYAQLIEAILQAALQRQPSVAFFPASLEPV